MGLLGRIADRVKTEPVILLALVVGSAVLAVPNFASSTSFAISDPGALDFALCGALILGTCLSFVFSLGTYVRVVRGFGLIVGTGLVAFEIWCLLQRNHVDGWHVLCTRPGLDQIQHGIRLLASVALIQACAQDGSRDGRISSADAVAAGMTFLVGGGLLFVFVSGSRSVAYALLAPDHASIVGSVVAFSCYGLVLLAVLACGLGRASWVLVCPYFAGTIVATALLAVCENRLNMPLALDVPGSLICCLGSVALPVGALARLSRPLSEEREDSLDGGQRAGDEPKDDASRPRDMLQTALGRIEGYEGLSNREREVISLDLAGESADEITERLSVSRSSVGTYRSRAYHKLGVSDRQELLGLLLGNVEISVCDSSQEGLTVPACHPAVRSVLPPVLVVSALLALSCMLSPSALTFVCAPVLSVAVVASYANLFGRPGRWRDLCLEQIPDVLSCASVFGGALVLCMSDDRLGQIVCGVSIVVSWYVFARERRIEGAWTQLCVSSGAVCGLVVVPIASSVDPGGTVLVPCVAFLAAAALLAQWAACGKERAVLADYSLHGRGRARAYLMGRGLSELETDVTILTALGFSSRSVAASLCVSPHTVSQYRSRSYKRLGISGRDELRDLLRKEAGFR